MRCFEAVSAKSIFLRKNVYLLIHDLFHDFEQPRPQGAFPWLREKHPGDEVGFLNNA